MGIGNSCVESLGYDSFSIMGFEQSITEDYVIYQPINKTIVLRTLSLDDLNYTWRQLDDTHIAITPLAMNNMTYSPSYRWKITVGYNGTVHTWGANFKQLDFGVERIIEVPIDIYDFNITVGATSTQIVSSSENDGFVPGNIGHICMSPTGRIHVAYEGSADDLYYSKSDDYGSTWNTTEIEDLVTFKSVSVLCLNNGSVMISFIDETPNDLYIYESGDDGNNWGTKFLVIDVTTADSGGCAADGGSFVQCFAGDNIDTIWYNNLSNAAGSPVTVSDSSNDDVDYAEIVVNGNNNCSYILGGGTDNDELEIWSGCVNEWGKLNEVVLDDNSTVGPQGYAPDAAILDNVIHIAYVKSSHIYYMRIYANNFTVIYQDGITDGYNPSIAIVNDSVPSVHIFYSEYLGPAANGDIGYINSSDLSGQTNWDVTFPVDVSGLINLGQPNVLYNRYPIQSQVNDTLRFAFINLNGYIYYDNMTIPYYKPAPPNNPPTISSLTNSSTTNVSSLVSWSTNEAANESSTWGSCPSFSGTGTDTNSTFGTTHEVNLTSLSPDTNYCFNTTACDSLGACSSDHFNFTTEANPPPPNNMLNVSLHRPINGSNETTTTVEITCNASASDGLNTSSLYFMENGGGGTGIEDVVFVQSNWTRHKYNAPGQPLIVKLPSTPTENNLIFTGIAIDKNSGIITAPAGFKMIEDHPTGDTSSGAIAYKISNGTEQDVIWSWVNNEEATIWIGEYSGIDVNDPLDTSGENDTYSGALNVTNLVTMRANQSTSQADELAFGVFASDSGNAVDAGGRYWSQGYTLIFEQPVPQDSGAPFLALANKTLTSIQTAVTNFSHDESDESYGMIVTFKIASTGSGVSWHLNETKRMNGTSGSVTFVKELVDGSTYIWNCLVNDTDGDANWSITNRTFTVNTSFGVTDDFGPSVILNVPLDDSTISSSTNVTINCSSYDDNDVANITLYGNFSGGWGEQINFSTAGNNASIETNLSLTNLQSYLWNCRACDNASNCSFATTNYTFTINTLPPTNPGIEFVPPTPNDNTQQDINWVEVNVSVTETSLESFVWSWNHTNYTIFNESLVVAYNFDNVSELGECDTGNCTIYDWSGMGNHGNLTNHSDEGRDEAGIPEWTPNGKFGGAMIFDIDNSDNKGDSIMIGDSDSLNPYTKDFVMSFWFKCDYMLDADVSRKGSTGTTPATNSWYKLEIGGYAVANLLSLQFNTVDADDATIQSSTDVCDSDWHFGLGQRIGTTVELWIDGINQTSDMWVGQTDNTLAGSIYNDANLTIGSKDTQDDDFFNGTLDEYRLYINRSFSKEEIQIFYMSNLRKYDANKYNFYINQSLNVSTELNNGTYDYTAYANNTGGGGNETGERTVTIPITQQVYRKPMFGAMHTLHTNYSDGHSTTTINTSAEAQSHAFDWGSTNDHDTSLDQTKWDATNRTSNNFNSDNNFTYFFGTEWTSGLQHIHYIAQNVSVNQKDAGDTDFDTVAELTDWLSQNEGLGQQNHPCRSALVDWTNSVDSNETWIPLVEFKNKADWHWNKNWNCSDGSGCTTYTNPQVGGIGGVGETDNCWIKVALDQGLHLGFAVGSDDHTALPLNPEGYTGLYNATNWTREGVYETLKKRHTWAAEDNISMNVSINNGSETFVMGDIFNVSGANIDINYTINASAGETITNISLFFDGIIVNTTGVTGNQIIGGFNYTLPDDQEHYIFIEVIESDGDRAWNSPLYVTGSTAVDLCSCTQIKANNGVSCTENCELTSDCDLEGNNVYFSGSGILHVNNANLYNYGELKVHNSCELKGYNGGLIAP